VAATKSKTAKKSTAPRDVRAPRDHQTAKRRRIRRVTIPMDPAAVEDLEEARGRLDRTRMELNGDRDLRVARILTQRRASGGSAVGNEMDLGLVHAEVDVAIADELEPLEKAVSEALAHVDATSRTFEFHALGNTTYERLLGAHKPKDEDHEEVQARGEGQKAIYHGKTFGPALVEACCDELDHDEVDEIFNGDEWNMAEIVQLFWAAFEVNTQPTVVVR
jgi:hypothetical protein